MKGRYDRGESRLIEMVLQHAPRVYVRVLSSTAVRAEADYGMELTLVGENSFTGKFLSPTLSGAADLVSSARRNAAMDHPLLRGKTRRRAKLAQFSEKEKRVLRPLDSAAQRAKRNECELCRQTAVHA